MEQEFDGFTKAGFARLLKIFENTDDVVRITRAFSLASKSHRGQRWNKTEPFVNHPLRVALVLAEELHIHNVDIICAAMLYDVTEAAEVGEFGDRAGEIAQLSREEQKARDDGDSRSYASFIEHLSKASKEARYVKLAERLDTARALKNQGLLEKASRFKEETQKHVMPIAEKTDDKLAFKLSVALYELR